MQCQLFTSHLQVAQFSDRAMSTPNFPCRVQKKGNYFMTFGDDNNMKTQVNHSLLKTLDMIHINEHSQ